jgi:hypothetical protein
MRGTRVAVGQSGGHGVSVVALAAEISEDRSRCVIAAGWWDEDGRPVVEIVWSGDPSLAVVELVRLKARFVPVAVVVDGKSPSATLIEPLSRARITAREPSAQEMQVAAGDFRDLVRSGGLRHLDQPELTEAVRSVQQRRLAGGTSWLRRTDDGQADQAPLGAATLAVWALRHIKPIPPPDIF